MTEIPKIIHYCWFGDMPLPKNAQKCIESWSCLSDYKIYRWDDSNCYFNENEFVKTAYRNKKWAWLSDYYRLKALSNYGGIYLDVDVFVRRSFDPLLSNECFLGYLYNVAISMAVIGANKDSIIINNLISMYDTGLFLVGENQYERLYFAADEKSIHWVPNNEFITWYLISNYPDFKLNNTFQSLPHITVFPKEEFYTGKVFGRYYCRNVDAGTWRIKPSAGLKKKISIQIRKSPFLWAIYRPYIVRSIEKSTSFYRYLQSHPERR